MVSNWNFSHKKKHLQRGRCFMTKTPCYFVSVKLDVSYINSMSLL